MEKIEKNERDNMQRLTEKESLKYPSMIKLVNTTALKPINISF